MESHPSVGLKKDSKARRELPAPTLLGGFSLTEAHALENPANEFTTYYSQNFSISQLDAHPDHKQKLLHTLDAFGLQDIGFSVYSRKEGQLGELADKGRVYVLVHGWTATRDIYREMVEKILSQDKHAVILTFDGPGFGESPFRKDILTNTPTLREKVSAMSYADIIHFLTQDVARIEDFKDRVTLVGHSWGGAATINAVLKYGYHGVAIAPAYYADKDSMKRLKQRQKDIESMGEGNEDAKKILHAFQGSLEIPLEKGKVLGIPLTAKGLYQLLGHSINASAWLSRIWKESPRFTNPIIKRVFQIISKDLLGVYHTDPLVQERILGTLLEIHDSQIKQDWQNDDQKFALVAQCILKLSQGQPIPQDTEQLAHLENVRIVSGELDTLATPREIFTALAALSLSSLEFMADKVKQKEKTETSGAIARAIRASFDLFSKASQGIVKGEGHYGPVNMPETLTDILEESHRYTPNPNDDLFIVPKQNELKVQNPYPKSEYDLPVR